MVRRIVAVGLTLMLCLMVRAGAAQPQSPAPPGEKSPSVQKPGDASSGKAGPQPVRSNDEYYEYFKVFVDTLDQVERNYVTEVNRRELMEAAIEGMLSKLDPYSSYISRKETDHFRASMENEFGGIGVQIVGEGSQLIVLSPMVNTPAYRAGILAGDRIVAINGKAPEGMDLDSAMRKLKGRPGTQVTISVIHSGSTEEKKVTLTREIIHVESVLGDSRAADDHWEYFLDPQRRIAYLRLISFTRDAASDLREVLERLKRENMRGLILDLRFNAGGLLNAAIEVADLFVAKGRIVSTVGRNSPERVWEAHEPGTFDGFPMVVLVNRYSASASEIVAACLQDHKRAAIMGERTWGKGSVQNVIEMEDGHSLLKLTTASYRRPSGKNIHRFPDSKDEDQWGVTPDEGYLLKLDDRELTSLVRNRRDRDILHSHVRPAGDEALPGSQAKVEPASSSEKAKAANSPATTAPADKKPSGQPPAGTTKPAAKPAAKGGDAAGKSGVTQSRTKFVDRQLKAATDFLAEKLAKQPPDEVVAGPKP